MRSSGGRLFQLCLNHKVPGMGIIPCVQNIGATAHLAVLNVGLRTPGGLVHGRFVPLAASGALKSSRHPKILKDATAKERSPGNPQWENPNSTLAPHAAAMPVARTKAAAITRPEPVFLLHAWSTAASHMTNSKMANAANAFIHIAQTPPGPFQSVGAVPRAKVRQSPRCVTELTGAPGVPAERML
jgi:hypothetical protein